MHFGFLALRFSILIAFISDTFFQTVFNLLCFELYSSFFSHVIRCVSDFIRYIL